MALRHALSLTCMPVVAGAPSLVESGVIFISTAHGAEDYFILSSPVCRMALTLIKKKKKKK
ncbi:hypothetical protein, partial [Salmonella enterica]|uniref:hypothetical protein n=1 Tax=Salmonella enterica TaxID=28901 RepID=UPI001C38ABAA